MTFGIWAVDALLLGRPAAIRFGQLPSRQFAINAAWLELALIDIDLRVAHHCLGSTT